MPIKSRIRTIPHYPKQGIMFRGFTTLLRDPVGLRITIDELEYGTDCIEVHTDAIQNGEQVLLVDDLLATGGMAEATTSLITKIGDEIIECTFVIDLPDIGGRKRLENKGYSVFSLTEFEGS